MVVLKKGKKLRSEIRKQLIANRNSLNIIKNHYQRTGNNRHQLLISLKEKILLELREQSVFNVFQDKEIEYYIENEVLRYLNNLRIKPSLLKRKPIKTFIQGAPTVIFLVGLLIFVQIMSYIFGNGATDTSTVYRFGALQSGDTNPEELFRVITYIFVHIGGTFHLLSNIACLLILGPPIERIYGSERFMVIFLLTGFFGGIFILFFSDYVITAGSSSSIFGLIGIFIGMIIKNNNIIVRKNQYYILGTFFYNIIYTLTVPNIPIAALLAGLVGGIILSFIMTPRPFKRLVESKFSKSFIKMLFIFASCFLVLFYLPKYFVTGEMISLVDKGINKLHDERFTNYFTGSEIDDHDHTRLIVDASQLIDHYSGGYVTLSEEEKEYILQNIEDFRYEADHSRVLDKSKAQKINIKELKEDTTKSLTTFTSFIGNLVYIEKFEYRDLPITYAIIQEGNYTGSRTRYYNYTVIMFGKANDIFVGDSVITYGLPVGNYAYQNTLGGKINSYMVLGSLIEKVN